MRESKVNTETVEAALSNDTGGSVFPLSRFASSPKGDAPGGLAEPVPRVRWRCRSASFGTGVDTGSALGYNRGLCWHHPQTQGTKNMASAKPKKKNPRLASGRKRVSQDVKIISANTSLRS